MTNEEKARNIASQWCNCYKCDGIVRDTRNKCNKDTMITCHQWYHSYRAAKLACSEKDQQFKEYLEKRKKQAEEATKIFDDELHIRIHQSKINLINEIINELFKED